MRMLITAGNTQTPLDRVRCITNIFSGRTGTTIAQAAFERGNDICLLTSHPHLAEVPAPRIGWRVRPFRTFDELEELMADEVLHGQYDCVIHCAAVSDYRHAGTFTCSDATVFEAETGQWLGNTPSPRLVNVQGGKIKSSYPELWVRLLPAPKLVDKIRTEWRFTGILVKFKLEVGLPDDRLVEVAESARRASTADLIVANTLDGMHACAFLGPTSTGYRRIERQHLADVLLDLLETSPRAQPAGWCPTPVALSGVTA